MRSYADALAWVKGQVKFPSQDWSNLCQMISRTAVGADAWAPSAREAFNQIPAKHKHASWPPPPGAIAYWGNPDYGFGHATFVGDGVLYSNDIYRKGKIDPVRMTKSASQMPFVTQWGLAYRGWIDWTPSGAINLKKAATLSPHQIHVNHVAVTGPGSTPASTPAHLSPHQQHLLHLARTAKPAPSVGSGSGPYWLLRFLRARKTEVGVFERAYWAAGMRESGGNASCVYPRSPADWAPKNPDAAPFWDTGVYQISSRHWPMVKKMFPDAVDMRVMLDAEKNWRFAQTLKWSDWGLVISPDGKSYRFDWTGWPSPYRPGESGAVAAEKAFKYWWDQYPVAVKKVYGETV